MNREQENRPDVAEQNMGQGNPEDPKAKFEGIVAAGATKAKENGSAESGGLNRELELKRRIKEASGTVKEKPDHYHLEAWKQRLEKDTQSLAANEAAMEARINALPAEEASQFREEYQRTIRTIESYDEAMENHKGSLEDKQKMGAEQDKHIAKLAVLEKRLSKMGTVDKSKAAAKTENPHKKTAESRDARVGQLRVYIDVAEKQIAGFQELRDHLNEPDYTLKSEASRGAQVKQYGGANEASVNRQIELQNNQIEALNREIKDLSE